MTARQPSRWTGASIVLSGDTAASPLDLANGANVTVLLNNTNTLTATSGAAGIHVTTGRTLKISSTAGDGSESGTFTVKGGTYIPSDAGGAGIGGNKNESGGAITIAGGKVYVTAGNEGAGIGGGAWFDGSEINIKGGYVETEGRNGGSGIGGGIAGNGGTIHINFPSGTSRGMAVAPGAWYYEEHPGTRGGSFNGVADDWPAGPA
ncbi:MAG: hypothetical protein MdMp014T_2493 [Treponematales bacterium]